MGETVVKTEEPIETVEAGTNIVNANTSAVVPATDLDESPTLAVTECQLYIQKGDIPEIVTSLLKISKFKVIFKMEMKQPFFLIRNFILYIKNFNFHISI